MRKYTKEEKQKIKARLDKKYKSKKEKKKKSNGKKDYSSIVNNSKVFSKKKRMNKAKKTAKDKKIEFVMKEFADGKLKSSDGKIVTDRDQALAIAYSEAEDMQKARYIKKDGSYFKLSKAKKMPVGTVSNGRKKVAEGKWIPVDKKEQSTKEEIGEKKDKKDDITDKEESKKEKIKNALKKIATIFADALSEKDVVQPTGQAIEEKGEQIKANQEARKKKAALEKQKKIESKEKQKKGK